jgi:hypothetical protein
MVHQRRSGHTSSGWRTSCINQQSPRICSFRPNNAVRGNSATGGLGVVRAHTVLHPEPDNPVQQQRTKEQRHAPHDQNNQNAEPINTHCFPRIRTVDQCREHSEGTRVNRYMYQHPPQRARLHKLPVRLPTLPLPCPARFERQRPDGMFPTKFTQSASAEGRHPH